MLNKIIKSCEYVSDNSKYVSINKEQLDNFINSIENIEMNNWLSSSPFGLLSLSTETIINFLLIFESIDFSFWGNPKWTINTNDGQLDGSIGLLYALLKYVKENKTTDFSKITEVEFSNILKGNVKIPLLKERLEIVRKISNTVNEKMNGNFYNYISKITSDKELFNVIITHFDSFKDERTYEGKAIYFYKLAQLLTSDILYVRKIKENINVDCSNLIGCADYKIPQVLRALNILVYNEELSNIIDDKKEILENSLYEVEIRANMITIINYINQKTNYKYNRININDYLFMKKGDKSLNLKPYHLTRCKEY